MRVLFLIFLLFCFCSTSNAEQKHYVFGLKAVTVNGLTLDISYGDGTLITVHISDCNICNKLEIDINNDLRELNDGKSKYPIVTGIKTWVDGEDTCYTTNSNFIKINKTVIKVPKKIEGCK